MEKMRFAPTGHVNSPPSILMWSRSTSSRAQDGSWVVEVHQVVHDQKGNLLLDTIVYHTYQFRDGLIARMDIAAGSSADRQNHQRQSTVSFVIPLYRLSVAP